MHKEIREQTHQARVEDVLSKLEDPTDNPIDVDRQTGAPRNMDLGMHSALLVQGTGQAKWTAGFTLKKNDKQAAQCTAL
jgi:hypothetical protein